MLPIIPFDLDWLSQHFGLNKQNVIKGSFNFDIGTNYELQFKDPEHMKSFKDRIEAAGVSTYYAGASTISIDYHSGYKLLRATNTLEEGLAPFNLEFLSTYFKLNKDLVLKNRNEFPQKYTVTFRKREGAIQFYQNMSSKGFQAILRDSDISFTSAMAPYLLKAALNESKPLAAIETTRKTTYESTPSVSEVANSKKGSPKWFVQIENKTVVYTPEDKDVPLKSIVINKPKYGPLELQLQECSPQIVERLKSSGYFLGRIRSFSIPNNSDSLSPHHCVYIDISTKAESEKLVSGFFSIIGEFVTHVGNIVLHFNKALLPLLDNEMVYKLCKGSVDPYSYSLKNSKTLQSTISKTIEAEFISGRNTLEVFVSVVDIKNCHVQKIITQRETKAIFEYNYNIWEESTRVYQDVWFDTAENMRLIYDKLAQSRIRKTTSAWEMDIHENKCIRMSRFPVMLALVELFYTDKEYKLLIKKHWALTGLQATFDENIPQSALFPALDEIKNNDSTFTTSNGSVLTPEIVPKMTPSYGTASNTPGTLFAQSANQTAARLTEQERHTTQILINEITYLLIGYKRNKNKNIPISTDISLRNSLIEVQLAQLRGVLDGHPNWANEHFNITLGHNKPNRSEGAPIKPANIKSDTLCNIVAFFEENQAERLQTQHTI